MTEKEYQERRVNEKCLQAVNDVIDALERCEELEVDGDMPILPEEDSLITYYKKVRKRVININNDFLRRIGE